jgi:homoserine kinase
LDLHLEVAAEPAETFSISAQGRDAQVCGKVEGNLIFDTYRRILAENNRPMQPLHLDVKNEIPLGMGCGSSAAARLAGIALAVHFGELGWRENEILATATFLEGHPDNVTACWLGGMTVSAVAPPHQDRHHGQRSQCLSSVQVARIDVPEHWRAVVVLPHESIRTEESRKKLPEFYRRADVVANLQYSTLLLAAFVFGRNEWLRAAMLDRLHQPYRAAICPLLGRLQPLVGVAGVLGVALSGAGPGVLLIVEREQNPEELHLSVKNALQEMAGAEILQCGFQSRGGAQNTH